MNNDTLISVCIPVYNGEKYLAQAIDCILKQTYRNFEIIIVDNCSTDNTSEIAKKHASNDTRINYYKNERHVNMAENWNKAVLLAKGEYIKILCADDIIEPEYLEEFSTILYEHPNVSLVTSYEQFIGNRDNIRIIHNLNANEEIDGKIAQKKLLTEGNFVGCPSAVMFRRKDLYIGLFSNIFSTWMLDIDMWMRLLSVGNLYIRPKILYHSRIHNNQETSVGNKFIFLKEELTLRKLAFDFPKVYGDYTNQEKKYIHHRMMNMLVNEGFKEKNLKALLLTTKIGMEYDWLLFIYTCVKKLFYKIINPKLVRKTKKRLKNIIKPRENKIAYEKPNKPIFLENVTLVSVSSIKLKNAVKALEKSMDGIEYAEIILIAPKKPLFLNKKITFKQCGENDLKSKNPSDTSDYSKFMLYELGKYITTDFVLIVHNDGYVLRPTKWNDIFLNYDYIGAPWPKNKFFTNDGTNIRIGNGGFSLRSKKMLSAFNKLNLPFTDNKTGFYNEDGAICSYYRKLLEDYGIKFAPVEIASMFSHELDCDDSYSQPFGFHKFKK